MSLSIAEAATWAYDLRGEADMLEYVNQLAMPKNAWANGTITLEDGSSISINEEDGTYAFTFNDGRKTPETRPQQMNPHNHPWRTPAPIFPKHTDQTVWKTAIAKLLVQQGWDPPEIPEDLPLPITRHLVEQIEPRIEEQLQLLLDRHEPPEALKALLNQETARLADTLLENITPETASEISALARNRKMEQDSRIQQRQDAREQLYRN